MKKLLYAFLALILPGTIINSCSSGPVIPESMPEIIFTQSDNSSWNSSHYLWGYFVGYVDLEQGEYELVPVRSIDTHFNVLGFLEFAPCSDCVQISGVDITPDGDLLADFTITHPFQNMAFSGFDVRGILMFDGSAEFPVAGVTASDSNAGDGEVINADGYTALYNFTTTGAGPNGLQGYLEGKIATSTDPDATINGYKRFVTPDILNNRNAFYAGDEITAQYEVSLPGGPLVFGYAVDASWVPPTTTPVTNPSADFPAEANSVEAWRLDVEVSANTLTEGGGSANLKIRIFDYDGPDSYKVPVVECPYLFDGQAVATQVSVNDKFADYVAFISNSNNAGPGTYKFLVRVKETAADSAPPHLDLTAYQLINIEIPDFTGYAPVAIASVSNPNPSAGELLAFDGTDSIDTDNNGQSIVLYEWDIDGDGTYDGTGALFEYTYQYGGTYDVQLRVTDDEGEKDTLDQPLALDVTEGGWVKTWGSTNWVETSVMTMDTADDSVYIFGDFRGTVDFDPGPMEYNLSAPNSRTYLIKFDKVGNFEWVRAWDDGDPMQEQAVLVDSMSNVYVCGSFYGMTDLNPGPGSEEYTSAGTDAYVVSFTSEGEHRWTRVLTGSSTQVFSSAGISPSDEIILGGYDDRFIMDLDPGPGTDTFNSAGPLDCIVVKLDQSGDYMWGYVFGGTGDEFIYDLAVDQSGNVNIIGVFDSGIIEFNPGGTSHQHSNLGSDDAYLLQLTSSGNYFWSRTWGSASDEDVNYVSVFASGSIFVAGAFSDTVDFDPGAGTDERTNAGGKDPFLMKFDASGNYQWVQSWGGTGGDEPAGLHASDNGKVYILTEYYSNDVDFDPGPDVLNFPAWGSDDIAVSIFDASGTLVNAAHYGSDDSDDSTGIITDSQERIYISGNWYQGVMDFDPGPDEYIVIPKSANDESYLLKLMPDLSF
ncbi:MAG TPA: PKD domain-containing protein [bacterium]|jgi:hypothetical protein